MRGSDGESPAYRVKVFSLRCNLVKFNTIFNSKKKVLRFNFRCPLWPAPEANTAVFHWRSSSERSQQGASAATQNSTRQTERTAEAAPVSVQEFPHRGPAAQRNSPTKHQHRQTQAQTLATSPRCAGHGQLRQVRLVARWSLPHSYSLTLRQSRILLAPGQVPKTEIGGVYYFFAKHIAKP